MEVFCFRHGETGNSNHLTKDGAEQVKKLAKNMLIIEKVEKDRKIIPENTLILTSPVARAVETAEIIAEVMNLLEPQKVDWLFENSDVRIDLETRINKERDKIENLIIVSHLPELEKIVGSSRIELIKRGVWEKISL